jgi:hypothetical protein
MFLYAMQAVPLEMGGRYYELQFIFQPLHLFYAALYASVYLYDKEANSDIFWVT